METRKALEKIVCEVMGKKVEIKEDINLMYDFNMDSIQIMNVIVMIEDQFDIEFELDELNIDNMISFSKLVELIEEIKKE